MTQGSSDFGILTASDVKAGVSQADAVTPTVPTIRRTTGTKA